MASEVKIKIKIDDNGSLSVVAKEANKASKATEKLGTATSKTNKTRSKYHKQEKGVAGATSNSTKGFAKQVQTLNGGSSSLVGAYATLAAHVFAVTAAFGVLSRNAGFKQLEQGITFTGRAAGINLPIIADNLKKITDGAISTADAMKAVAIGTSAGFSTSQLEGLTKVAKGASLALGRDMTDAMDRLIRGAAKLEPEILDELGIMVRLDKTAADFGATIGKNAEQLSVFEKRMAFTNAIIKQGEEKFGALNAVIEVNPYSKLASQFDTLIKGVIGGLDTFLGPTIGLIAGSMGMLIGVMGVFATSIIKMMVPALTQGGKAAAAMADKMHQNARAQIASAKTFEKAPAVYQKLQVKMAAGTATAKDMKNGMDSLTRSIAMHNQQIAKQPKKYAAGSAALKVKQATVKQVEAALHQLTAAQKLETQATLQAGRADVLNSASNSSLTATYFALTVQIRAEHAALTAETIATNFATRAKQRLALAASQAALSLRVFGVALLNAIPMIGQILFLLSLAYAAYEKFFKAEPSALEKQLEETKKVLEGFPGIVTQLADSYAAAADDSQRFEVSLRAQVGLVGEVADQMRKAISVQKSAIITEQAQAKAALARFNIQKDNPLEKAKKKAKDTMGDGSSIKREDFKDTGYSWWRKTAEENYQAALADHAKYTKVLMNQAEQQYGEYSVHGTKYFSELAELERQIVKTSQKEIDLEKTRSAQIMILSEGIVFQQLMNKGMKEGSEEAVVGAATLAGLNKGLDQMTQATTVQGIEDIADGMQGVAAQSKAALKALDAAADVVAKIDALFKKSNKPTGLFTDHMTELQSAVDNIGDQDKFSEIWKRYDAAFKKYGASTKKEAEDILKKMEDVRVYNNNTGKREHKQKETVYQENKGGNTAKALRTLTAAYEEDLRINKIRVELAQGKGQAGILAAEQQRLDILLKIRENEEAILKAKFETNSRVMGDPGAINETAESMMPLFDKGGVMDEGKTSEKFAAMNEAMQPFLANLRSLGPQGEFISSVVQGGLVVGESFTNLFEKMTTESMDTVEGMAGVAAAGLQAAGAALSTINNIMQAEANQQLSMIDKQIAAEKKRDGQSEKSLKKIREMEKKKEKIKKKAFDDNKKMQMAMVVINTAASIAMVAAQTGIYSPPFIATMVTLGALQIAAIASTSYEGGGPGIESSGAGKNSSVSVGERENTVDLSKSQSAVGELGYARGEDGVGDANSFKPAFTGARYRASGGSAGFIVGEQGPELFMPDTPGSIVSAGDTESAGGSSNVNISIQALDASGVEDILVSQRANIISMIRESANQVGDTFLENVDTTGDGATY